MTQIVAKIPSRVAPYTTPLMPDAAASDKPLRVVLWGTYDLGKPRTRILRGGLVQIGVELTEIHADVWSSDEDKSQLSLAWMILRLFQLLFAYPALIYRYLRAPAHDLVIVPYLGQFDVIVLWPFAKLRGPAVRLFLLFLRIRTVGMPLTTGPDISAATLARICATEPAGWNLHHRNFISLHENDLCLPHSSPIDKPLSSK